MPSDEALKAAREVLRDVFAYPERGDAELEPKMAEIIDRHMPKHDPKSALATAAYYKNENERLHVRIKDLLEYSEPLKDRSDLRALFVEAAEMIEYLRHIALPGGDWKGDLVARLRRAAEEMK